MLEEGKNLTRVWLLLGQLVGKTLSVFALAKSRVYNKNPLFPLQLT
jgi:hypothetical protein